MANSAAENGVHFRPARSEDLPAIVQMLADDPLGSKREDNSGQLAPCYQAAFQAIDADPNNELIVGVHDDQLVAVLQITFIPNLSHQGGWRARLSKGAES